MARWVSRLRRGVFLGEASHQGPPCLAVLLGWQARGTPSSTWAGTLALAQVPGLVSSLLVEAAHQVSSLLGLRGGVRASRCRGEHR